VLVTSKTSMPNFMLDLEESVQNCKKNRAVRPRATKKGRGTVVVNLDQYSPEITDEEKQHQEELQDVMRHIFIEDPDAWEQVQDNMKKTFSLQRKDIISAKKVVEMTTEMDEMDTDDPGSITAMQTLKKGWPFLFTAQGIQQHHQKLGPKDLVAAYKKFEEDGELDILLHYLITSTKCNMENLVVRIKAESAASGEFQTMKLMILMEMLSNHFGEDINDIFIPVEVSLGIEHPSYCFPNSQLT